jgi:phenylacetate-coenzyme A ligase PaaK-like adenylate-forming protein
MIDWDSWPAFGLRSAEKGAKLSSALEALTRHHYERCAPYRAVLDARNAMASLDRGLETIPFLPVGLFKFEELLSIPRDQVAKVVTSSGTTSQQVSRVFLDRDTAASQTRALVTILQDFIGKDRSPMMIVDHPSIIRDRTSFSARAAGILGISNFGRAHRYLLSDADMSLDVGVLSEFLETHKGRPKLMFGFTFMVWRYLYQELRRLGHHPDLSEVTLIHSGGWKKLQDVAVGNRDFKAALSESTGMRRIHNFYGMAEQVGSVFVECEQGVLHTPAYADVLVRDPSTWRLLPNGQRGLIQVLSVLPESYPGHSLLTEDLGEILGEDDCACGRLGKTFAVFGRLARSEVRGCSDTHAPAAGLG